MSAKQLLQSAAAEINESVRRAHVSYDDAAAAISPPVFEYSFSPAPPRAIAVAPLTGISRGEHSSEHASTGPEGVCWVCCEGGHSFHHLIPMGCACRMPQASNPGLAGRSPGRSCSATHTFEPRLGQAARPASPTCGASSRWRCTTCAAGRPATCAGRSSPAKRMWASRARAGSGCAGVPPRTTSASSSPVCHRGLEP